MSPDPNDAPADAASARPVQADVTTTTAAGGVLVAVALYNDTDVDVRVRVENDLDGPVLPPRREGVPAAGWDTDGFTGDVSAESRLGIGYACPCRGEPPDGTDPVSVDVLGPAADGDADAPESDRVAAAVRSLGRAAPPADAVPVATPPAADPDRPPAGRSVRRRDGPSEPEPPDGPDPVAAWLDTVEARVRRAERLTDATADEAAAVLDACGGVDGVATLPDDIARDLAALRAVGDRIDGLVTRADAAAPGPVVSSLAAAVDGDAPASAADGVESTPEDAGRRRGATR